MNWPGGRRSRDRRRSNAPSWRCTDPRTNVLSGRDRPCCVELGWLVVRLKVVTLVLMWDISSSSGTNEEECRTCMRTGGRRRCWMDRDLPTLCHHGHGSKKVTCLANAATPTNNHCAVPREGQRKQDSCTSEESPLCLTTFLQEHSDS